MEGLAFDNHSLGVGVRVMTGSSRMRIGQLYLQIKAMEDFAMLCKQLCEMGNSRTKSG